MRRLFAVVAVGSALALGACSLPAGVDGHLVDDWGAIAAPAGTAPVVGDCYPSNSVNMLENAPVACTADHVLDAVYVGTFTGGDAARSTPPPAGSPAIITAYGRCLGPAKAYLGGDWHTGLLVMSVAVPDTDGWAGGARWFRCDVSQVATPDSGATVVYHRSLKGALVAPSALIITCINWTDHKTYIDSYRVASCTRAHNGEFAGIYTGPDIPYPSTAAKQESLKDKGCEGVVSKFLGFPSVSAYVSNTVGWAWSYLDKAQWEMGDRGLRCYAAAFTRSGKMIGSVKGIRSGTAKS